MNTPRFLKKDICRGCKGAHLTKVLDLGNMPPANAFFDPAQKAAEDIFPLVAYVCDDCRLFQLLDVVDPKILFSRYDYLTSASAPLAEHFREEARYLARRFFLGKNDLLLEIGGNDGVLLEEAKKTSRVLNVEPATNIAAMSKANGIETVNEFFTEKLADKILKKYGKAKIIAANNVMAHIDDLDDTFNGIKVLLADEGAFVFEVHWLGNLIGDGGFDQIYHEHLCYFSLTALKILVERMGLKIFDVELVPIHGKSMRVYVAREVPIRKSVDDFLEKEAKLGFNKMETFAKFKSKVAKNRKKIIAMLADLKKNHKTIIGYGASAKGNTLLNYCGITADLVDFIVDTTPLKQGLCTPGSRIPIYAPKKLQENIPDYILLLAWNYADSIIAKEADLRRKGVKFILPVPEPRIV